MEQLSHQLERRRGIQPRVGMVGLVGGGVGGRGWRLIDEAANGGGQTRGGADAEAEHTRRAL